MCDVTNTGKPVIPVNFFLYLQFNAETTDDVMPLMSYLKFTCHYLECLYDPLSVWRLSLEKFVLFLIHVADEYYVAIYSFFADYLQFICIIMAITWHLCSHRHCMSTNEIH